MEIIQGIKMKLLLELQDEDVGMKSKKVKMKKRLAARAIIFKDNKIALMHVTRDHYHKLPGGGAERGETTEQALKREILEETGCRIKITSEVGKIIEHRNRTDVGILQRDSGTLQTAYCYIAKMTKQGSLSLDEGESQAGYKLEWVTLNSAINIIKNENPRIYDGKFIVKRDLAFLKETKRIIDRRN